LSKLFTIIALSLLTACSSTIPVRHYQLQAYTIAPEKMHVAPFSRTVTLGIKTVKLPSMLNRHSLVSDNKGSSITVASHDVWAGSLDDNFTQVLGELITDNLGVSDVVTEPWNSRFRPEFQLQFDVLKFSGELGGKVSFKVHWVLSGDFGKQKLLSQNYELSIKARDESYNEYVQALNRLLISFSKQISESFIKQHILQYLDQEHNLEN